ncbi:unnamed protein product [Paramecium octaurelia]|uniref:Uncharacterized protein n=1 Tax=Paramecium octaurelia TaxID=43137 RepID=A0A8S1V7C4_PAROT|nr:unnamed protein product [Paramecium octaurelia]
MKDLKQLERIATQKVVYFQKSTTYFREQTFASSVSRLYNAYLKLVNNFDSLGHQRKSELCPKIQQIEFPSKYRKLKCQIYSNGIPKKQNYNQTKLLQYFMYFKNETTF